MARRERIDQRGHAGRGCGEKAPVQHGDEAQDREKPRETMEAGQPRALTEKQRVERKRRARERPEEAKLELVAGKPRQQAAVAHQAGCAGRSTDEIVELERAPDHFRRLVEQHPAMDHIVLEQRPVQRRKREQDRENECQRHR